MSFSPIGSLFPWLDISPTIKTTFATWPVWRDSTTKEPKFRPLAKRDAHRLWHEARHFERQTRQPGKQDGALGRNGLAVLHALLFDFLNYVTGALWPSYEAIAKAANISVRSAARALVNLKDAGVVNERKSRLCCRQKRLALASWREIERTKAWNVAYVIVKALRNLPEGVLGDWERNFLHGIAAWRGELTTRQAEKLLQIRDDVTPTKEVGYGRFSVRLLLQKCFEARLDLNEDDENWLMARRTADPLTVRRRDAGRLLRCARDLNLIEEE